MTDEKIKAIITDTVNTAILKLKASGILKDGQKTAFEKTEALLYQYPELKKVDQPYARKVVAEIEALLRDYKQEPYIDAVKLYYFDRLTNEAVGWKIGCDERTARRNRKRLVEAFSVRLVSDDFIRELLL